MKMKDLKGSLETYDQLKILERKGVQDSVQALHARTFKKDDGFERHKGIQDKFKKHTSSRSHKIKLDGKIESFKKGEGTSNSNQQMTQSKNMNHI